MSPSTRVSELGPAPVPSSGWHRQDQDDDIDLRVYARRLWRRRYIVLAGTLLAGVAALIVGLATQPAYSASVVLALSSSKLNSTQGPPLTTASYRPILESQNLAAKIVKEFGLDKRGISSSNFFGSVVTIDEVRNSTVFILRARLDDPKLAADVANRTAFLAVDESRRLNQDEAIRTRDSLKAQVAEAQERLEQAEQKLLDFKTASQIELMRKDADAMLIEREGLLNLMVRIEAERARLAKAEQELASRQRLDTVHRSIDSDPALLEAARKSGQSTDALGLQLKDESINQTYQELDSQIAESRTALAGMEQRKQELVNVRKLDAPQQAQLINLYKAESLELTFKADADLARKVYDEVAKVYQTAQLQVAGRSAELQTVENALQSDRPLTRNVARNTAIALVAGLVLSCLLALAYDGLQRDAAAA